MAQFEPAKKLKTDFNGGEEFVDGDGLSAATLNNIVESTLYAQDHVGTGEGGAALTNYYGESKEEGYTQYYINGEAQAKNYYNLGVYDTAAVGENGNVVITRRTGIKVVGMEDILAPNATYSNVMYYRIAKPTDYLYYNKYSFVGVTTNKYPARGALTTGVWDTANHIGILFGSADATYFWIGFPIGTTLEQAKAAIVGLVIQYQLTENNECTEEVIENQPLHTLPQHGEQWLRNEYEKGLNLLNCSAFPISATSVTSNTSAQFYMNFGGTTFYGDTINVTQADVVQRLVFAATTDKTYNSFSVGFRGNYSSASANVNGSFKTVKGQTYTLIVRIDTFSTTKVVIKNIMLVKGTVGEIPYVPYSGGELVREGSAYGGSSATIEDIVARLDNLGFRSGSLSFPVSATATQNEIKRQGNYCILNLTVTLQLSKFPASGIVVATLPSGFSAVAGQFLYGLLHSTVAHKTYYTTYKIVDNNLIVDSLREVGDTTDPGFNFVTTITLMGAGYEAEPLSNITVATA